MKNEELKARLGQAARKARLHAAMTQADVAAGAGVAPEVYGRIERGRMMPSVPTLRRMCVTLGLSADQLLALMEEGQEPEWLKSLREPKDPPTLTRLLRNLRKLSLPELNALGQVAVVLVAAGTRGRRLPPGWKEPGQGGRRNGPKSRPPSSG